MINTASHQTMFEMYSPEIGFDDDYKAHLVSIFNPILDAIDERNPDTKSRTRAYNTCDTLFSDLFTYYESMSPDESVDLYANHVVSVFQVLEEARPENKTEIETLISASVKGIIVNNRQDVSEIDQQVTEIYKKVSKPVNGEDDSGDQPQKGNREVQDLCFHKWSNAIPKWIVDSVLKLDVLKSTFERFSMEHYIKSIDVSINKNLLGATVVELYQDNHMYLMPVRRKNEVKKEVIDEVESTAKRLWEYRNQFVARMDNMYKIPTILFPPRLIGAHADFDGLEADFQSLLIGLKAEFTNRIDNGFSLYPKCEAVICMYTLFALYSSLEFGRYRKASAELFNSYSDGRLNLPLLSNPTLARYVARSKFFTKKFFTNPRFGSIAGKVVTRALEHQDE